MAEDINERVRGIGEGNLLADSFKNTVYEADPKPHISVLTG